jgi:hypothetical protein
LNNCDKTDPKHQKKKLYNKEKIKKLKLKLDNVIQQRINNKLFNSSLTIFQTNKIDKLYENDNIKIYENFEDNKKKLIIPKKKYDIKKLLILQSKLF